MSTIDWARLARPAVIVALACAGACASGEPDDTTMAFTEQPMDPAQVAGNGAGAMAPLLPSAGTGAAAGTGTAGTLAVQPVSGTGGAGTGSADSVSGGSSATGGTSGLPDGTLEGPDAGEGGGGTSGGDTGGSAGTGASAGTGGVAGGPCTGKQGARGNQTRDWNLVQYIVHFPNNLDPNKPVPLVFVAHGFTMSGALMQSITGFDAVADREGFVVVYPNGDGGAFPWNVGAAACAPGGLISAGAADSFGYLDAMRESIEQDQCINPEQIFVTGFSMGGYFSHHVGCQRGNEFARAVGPHSGGTYPGTCPAAPVPNFIMHGGSDTFIDHNLCGKGARDFWLERNKCASQFETKPVSGGSCEWYKDCDPNGQTVYCEFTGVGHAWASGATAAVWDFFKSYL